MSRSRIATSLGLSVLVAVIAIVLTMAGAIGSHAASASASAPAVKLQGCGQMFNLPACASETGAVSSLLPAWLTTPCAEEDSTDCYWDAQSAGNGEGESFYAISLRRGSVCVIYWHDRAGSYCQDDSTSPAGKHWQPVTRELADAMSEGDEAGNARDWQACAIRFGDTTVTVCPDGRVFTS